MPATAAKAWECVEGCENDGNDAVVLGWWGETPISGVGRTPTLPPTTTDSHRSTPHPLAARGCSHHAPSRRYPGRR